MAYETVPTVPSSIKRSRQYQAWTRLVIKPKLTMLLVPARSMTQLVSKVGTAGGAGLGAAAGAGADRGKP